MEKKYRIILICCFVMYLGNASSRTFSLSDCIDYAFANRVELQKQQIAGNYYRRQHIYSRLSRLPSLSGRANYQQVFDKNNQLTQSATAELLSELVLFRGFQTFNSVRQSRLLRERNQSHTEKIRNDIKLEIIEIYYSLLLAQENIKILDNSIQSAERQISLITEAVRAGRTSHVDLLEMQAQLERERSNLIAVVKQYERDFIRLKRAMNFQGEDAFSIVTPPEIEITLGELENLFAERVWSNFLPEFQLARQDSLFAVLDLRRIRGQYAPYLSLFGSLSSQFHSGETNSFSNQFGDNFQKLVGISLNIPIYSRYEIRRQQIGVERQLSNIELTNRQLHQDIYFEVKRLWQEVVHNKDILQTAEKRYELSRQIYEIRLEQYRLGSLSITDLLIAENSMNNAQIELAHARHSLQYNLTLINFFLGR